MPYFKFSVALELVLPIDDEHGMAPADEVAEELLLVCDVCGVEFRDGSYERCPQGASYRLFSTHSRLNVRQTMINHAQLCSPGPVVLGRGLVGNAVPPIVLRHITSIELDTEAYRRGGSCRTATCTCGWRGPQRATMAMVADDAMVHERSDPRVGD